MSKLVEIEAKPAKDASSAVIRLYGYHEGATLHMTAGGMGSTAMVFAHTPAEAREYAQMLRGAADALVDWALTQEQPQNFAAAEVAK